MTTSQQHTEKPRTIDYIPVFIKIAIASIILTTIAASPFHYFSLPLEFKQIFLIYISLPILLTILYIIDIQATTYTITQDSIIKKHNFINTYKQQIKFSNIDKTTIRQTIIQQLLGDHGTIEIHTTNPTKKPIELPAIKHAPTIHNYIIEQIDHDTPINEIKELQELTENVTQELTEQ